MNRGALALLLGAVLATVAICASNAQDSVSLIGLSANRTDAAVSIELHTTGPADFRVERFTMGDFVSVWSNQLTMADGVDEIPLELDRPELSDIVTGAALASESHHASIRFYLGPQADRAKVFLVADGDTATLTIRALEAAVDDVLPTLESSAKPQPAVDAPMVDQKPQRDDPLLDFIAQESPTEPAVVETSGTPEPVVQPPVAEPPVEVIHPAEQTSAPLKPVSLREPQLDAPPALPDETNKPDTIEPEPVPVEIPDRAPEPAEKPVSETTPATPSSDIESAPEVKPYEPKWESSPVKTPAQRVDPAPAGSFYLPREEKPAPISTPPATEGTALSEMPGFPLIGSPSSDAEINYQYIPADMQGSNSGNSGGASEEEETAPSLEEMMEIASQMAADMFGEQGTGAASGEAGVPAGPGAINTPNSGFRGSFQSEASISQGVTQPADSGKALLRGIQIDLFEIVGTPLDQAITLLIAPTDFNIIVDSSVGSNTVSLSFKDSRTDLKDAMDMLTRTYGLDYSVQANTVVVAAKDKINGQLVDYDARLFILSYADPLSVKEMLVATGLLTKEQVEIYVGEKEFLAVNDSTELAETTGRTNQESEKMQSNLSSTPRNAVLVKAVPEQMDKIAKIIERIDRKPKLIDLEVRVCEITETGRKNLGLTVNSDFLGNVSTGESWREQPNEFNAFEAFTLGSMQRQGLDFQVTLNHLFETGDATLLAQPKLNTVEGKQAIYFAGESIPYISERKIDPATGQETLTVEFIDIGVTLNFKPRLDNEGKLTIDVNPIVSSLIEMMEVTDGVFAPRSQNRQLRTTVRVGDKEPFALAGLISERETETISKIPLLAELPMVGKLFRNRRTDSTRTEIVVIVVPHITE